MQWIHDEMVSQWALEKGIVEAYRLFHRSIGSKEAARDYLEEFLGIPTSLFFAIESVVKKDADVSPNVLDSISLFSLFKGLYLPLSGMPPGRIENLFRLRCPYSQIDHRELVGKFLNQENGLGLTEKIAFLMGDPFLGKAAHIGQDTLFNILACIRLVSVDKLRDLLPRIGDIGVLFLEEVEKIKSDPPITAKEALIILQNLPKAGNTRKKEVLVDLFLRCGRMERYFLARAIMRRLYFGYEFRSSVLIQVLSAHYSVPEKVLENAIALSDLFHVCTVLEQEGAQGVKKIVLKPLNAVSPALASTNAPDEKTPFPLWVECKYDGIRLMVHKETNLWGRIGYAAFTRRKHDWLDLVAGLEMSFSLLPLKSFILDGELHGSIVDWDRGTRPATVYEIYRFLQGNTEPLVQLKYVAFDILYLEGQDITAYPLFQRRKLLEQIVSPLLELRPPLPVVLSQGCEVSNFQEFKKWYQLFLSQGHEGAIAKVPNSSYAMGKRTDDWLKKKRELFLDLVISGALWATGESGPQVFSAYVLSCRDEEGMKEIGRTEGLAQEKNFEIVQRIAMDGLLTGKNLEIRSGSAVRHGIHLGPSIVVTVRFEDVVKDSDSVYSLRDPKIVCIRPRGDMSPEDIDTYQTVRQLYMKDHLG